MQPPVTPLEEQVPRNCPKSRLLTCFDPSQNISCGLKISICHLLISFLSQIVLLLRHCRHVLQIVLVRCSVDSKHHPSWRHRDTWPRTYCLRTSLLLLLPGLLLGTASLLHRCATPFCTERQYTILPLYQYALSELTCILHSNQLRGGKSLLK